MKKDKTFAAIAKLQDVEAELHRLKNALDMANKAIEARPWRTITTEEIWGAWCEAAEVRDNGGVVVVAFAQAIEAKLKEKNA